MFIPSWPTAGLNSSVAPPSSFSSSSSSVTNPIEIPSFAKFVVVAFWAGLGRPLLFGGIFYNFCCWINSAVQSVESLHQSSIYNPESDISFKSCRNDICNVDSETIQVFKPIICHVVEHVIYCLVVAFEFYTYQNSFYCTKL